ncbi:MAG: ATP phosphoribosyltransferase regulatory subunit [Pikeienuella sp.]
MSASRPYLTSGRIGGDLDRLSALRANITKQFESAGAVMVEPETLQPADVMLDVYGEDIRARAYIVQDPAAGELCLRPDFTVPVARVHMQGGADPARYAYQGLVWRRQVPGSKRPNEYLQAGIELIGGVDPAKDDAEVFTLIRDALGEHVGPVITGDLSVVFAVIDAVVTTEARKAALRRHVWRPARFQALLDRFSNPPQPSANRRALLEADDQRRARMIAGAGRFVGLRSEAEIIARAAVLAEDASVAPLSAEAKQIIEAVLGIKGRTEDAVKQLRDLALPSMEAAINRIEMRMSALADRGVNAADLAFDAAFGRALEYYDGFVFEFKAPVQGLPPLGGGGRYDALTEILAHGTGSTAVGGVVRPEAIAACMESSQ